MKINVTLDNGYLPDIYSSQTNVKHEEQPVISFPIEIQDISPKASSLAISLIDYDAVPRTGSPFIHWLAANIPVATQIPADFSRNYNGPQGQTSWMSRFYSMSDSTFSNHYAGPNPPDKPHHYTLTVFALTQPLNLQDRFYYNDFLNQLHGNTINSCQLRLLAK